MTHHCTTCNRQVLHDGTTCCECAVTVDQPIASIERYAPEQFKRGENHALREVAKWCGAEHMPTYNWIKKRIEAKAAEADRLREALTMLRPKVLHHDPEYNGQRTNGPMPKWNGMLKMIDNALAGKEILNDPTPLITPRLWRERKHPHNPCTICPSRLAHRPPNYSSMSNPSATYSTSSASSGRSWSGCRLRRMGCRSKSDKSTSIETGPTTNHRSEARAFR